MCQWLSPVDALDAHEAATSAYLEGSCAWIFETKELVRWENTQGSKLWLSGFRKYRMILCRDVS